MLLPHEAQHVSVVHFFAKRVGDYYEGESALSGIVDNLKAGWTAITDLISVQSHDVHILSNE